MVIRPLTANDFDAVFEAFNAAFSDYVVPFSLTREQLAEMLQRRGWSPEASVAAFDDERMVAFTLNAVEGDRAYDTGTGVVPTHRRRGLARDLMLQSFGLLRGKTYLLEVIDSNVKAAELYRSLGFQETRGLQCWRYEASGLKVAEAQRLKGVEAQRLKVAESQSRKASESPSASTLSLCASAPLSLSGSEPSRPSDETLRLCDFETLRRWWDIHPSWQNSAASIARAGDQHVCLGDDDSYAILFPSNGDLSQLAVRPESRRKGLGKRLLVAAAGLAGKPLRIINIDERDPGIAAFLEASGATRTVRQLEMSLTL